MSHLCNIHDCTEPRCPESEFWCRRHYIQFRAAGMAEVNATPPGLEAQGKPVAAPPVSTGIRGKIRPFGKSNGD